jgi:hypothetical protein
VVVGPAGEEVFTDEFGRVKVQFHWDRLGESDENSSCWMRVVQDWSDVRAPALGFPRVGDEVVVDFLHGDIDQPIVLGRIYNGDDHLPPPATPPTDQSCPENEYVTGAEADGTIHCGPVAVLSNGGGFVEMSDSGKLKISALEVNIDASSLITIDGALIQLNGPGTPAARVSDFCIVPPLAAPFECHLLPGSPTVLIGSAPGGSP